MKKRFMYLAFALLLSIVATLACTSNKTIRQSTDTPLHVGLPKAFKMLEVGSSTISFSDQDSTGRHSIVFTYSGKDTTVEILGDTTKVLKVMARYLPLIVRQNQTP